MPVALIQQGTTHMQKIYSGTLATIVPLVEADPPEPPTLIIVGEVVKLREKLSWFSPPDEPQVGATTRVV
jgi:uroporphyrin-III C-methyltransferase/precorrin-2 dehydrogenase/sirohydrochlorin ferrochelatase